MVHETGIACGLAEVFVVNPTAELLLLNITPFFRLLISDFFEVFVINSIPGNVPYRRVEQKGILHENIFTTYPKDNVENIIFLYRLASLLFPTYFSHFPF